VKVLLFTLTLGARKLTERQARLLKLISGLMMLGLGLLMLLAPERLGDPKVAVALLGGALGAGALMAFWERRHGSRGVGA
jgi:hypothetical protein